LSKLLEGAHRGKIYAPEQWSDRARAPEQSEQFLVTPLADWSTCWLDNSRTGQVADWTTRGCHRPLHA